MTHLEVLRPLDDAIWEMSEAFDGMPDADLWVRPHPRLLSVGELAAHVGYGEICWLHAGFESPFGHESLRYYDHTIATPFSAPMSAEQVYAEVKRIHEACRSRILEALPNMDDVHPDRDDWTWGYTFRYMAFHIAYHTGQMYSVRHLLGHETSDN